MKMQWKATGSVQRTARRPDQRWIGVTTSGESGITRWSFPKMRAPVETWTSASANAAVANHAFAAIVAENTDVTMSVYVEFALARTYNGLIEPRETTRYDRNVSRLLVVPLVLLFGIAGVTYALAKWHPARPGVPKAVAGSVVLGDQYRGETVFQSSCSGCHGSNGSGGIGPRLQ